MSLFKNLYEQYENEIEKKVFDTLTTSTTVSVDVIKFCIMPLIKPYQHVRVIVNYAYMLINLFFTHRDYNSIVDFQHGSSLTYNFVNMLGSNPDHKFLKFALVCMISGSGDQHVGMCLLTRNELIFVKAKKYNDKLVQTYKKMKNIRKSRTLTETDVKKLHSELFKYLRTRGGLKGIKTVKKVHTKKLSY